MYVYADADRRLPGKLKLIPKPTIFDHTGTLFFAVALDYRHIENQATYSKGVVAKLSVWRASSNATM